MDEAVLTICGVTHWLWRAVDQTGMVLDILVQSRRDAQAAKRLMRKLLKRQCRVPRVIVTDKLRSYAAAKREVLPGVEHRQGRTLNNRAAVSFADIPPGDRCAMVSHRPTRRRERQMRRFKSARHAQRFLSAHSRIHNHFQLRRHRLTVTEHRAARDHAFRTWREVAGVASAAGNPHQPQGPGDALPINLITPTGSIHATTPPRSPTRTVFIAERCGAEDTE